MTRGDSIPTPEWLEIFRASCFDPYPLDGSGPIEPPADFCSIWINPGFSRKEEAIENAIRWHQAGHRVMCYLPMETSTRYAKRLLQYGVRRLYFERRPAGHPDGGTVTRPLSLAVHETICTTAPPSEARP